MLSVDLRNAFIDHTEDNFTCLLLRLIAKGDPEMRARLAKGFPMEVEAVRIYQTDCPYKDMQETEGLRVPDWEQIANRAKALFGPPPVIVWGKYRCTPVIERYAAGNVCLDLVSAVSDAEDDIMEGEPIATASVNAAGYVYDWDVIHVKDYAENVGLLAALQNQGIVGPVLDSIPSGYVNLPAVRIIHPVVCRMIKEKEL